MCRGGPPPVLSPFSLLTDSATSPSTGLPACPAAAATPGSRAAMRPSTPKARAQEDAAEAAAAGAAAGMDEDDAGVAWSGDAAAVTAAVGRPGGHRDAPDPVATGNVVRTVRACMVGAEKRKSRDKRRQCG